MEARYGTDALVLPAIQPRCICLFSAGRGGDPRRYLGLLQGLAQRGITVVAPHISMLSTSVPSKGELEARMDRLRASAELCAESGVPVVGLGHSIGATILLALAGARAETLAGDEVRPGQTTTFARLALLAPATDFFRRPGALKTLNLPVKVWVGANDTITPPQQAMFLQGALSAQIPVEIAVDDHAAHFTYMDEMPPHVIDPHPDRQAFLKTLATDLDRFFTT